MVASTMAYSMSGSSLQASNSFTNTSVLRQSLKRQCRAPVPERRRQIAPRTTRARDPQNSLYEQPVVTAAAPGVARFAQAMRFHLRPLGVRQHQSLNHIQAST
jgi:hypothetical protein